MSNPFMDEARRRAAKQAFNAAHGLPVLAKRIILTLILVGFGVWLMGWRQREMIPIEISIPLVLVMLLGTWLAPRSWFYLS
jgi:hypothetical protein